MKYRLRQGAGAYAWHLGLIGLVLGLLWTSIGFDLRHDRRLAERTGENDAANLSRAVYENITRTVEAVDQSLLFVRDAYQHDPVGFTQGSWASGGLFPADLHVQVFLAGRDGVIFWSNTGQGKSGSSIADPTYFQVQQSSVEDRMFIGQPVLDPVTAKWTIQFTRKLLAADGSFAGVVVVSLDSHYLSRFYQSIAIGNGLILLTTTSGIILACAPGGDSLLGGHAPADFLQATAIGNYRAVSGSDHVERMFSARRLQRYPLVVTVGLATQDVFASYEYNKKIYLVAGSLLSIASIVVGFIMIRQRHDLFASRQALSATLENMSQGIAMVDAAGKVPVLNQKAIDLLGLPPEFSRPGITYKEVVRWQFETKDFGDEATWNAPLKRVLEDGDQGDYTYERTRPNGMVLEVRTQALPDGAFVRTYTDITQRKQDEAALAAARERAAHAERMQVLGQLAGGIAHDFNNILQAVQGSASLIAKRASDAESVRRFSRMILDVTERGTSITRRLLAFARRGELRAEPVDVGPLIAALREVLSHTLGPHIIVEVHLADGMPPALADKGQLESVLVNLANNARDAMPGGGRLTIVANTEVVNAGSPAPIDLQPGRYVRLSVADTGCGMDQQTLTRALEPFFSTKPPGQGTGLGLSMAKGFVEQSGGGLSIESAPGRGTAVHLWLPATNRVETLSFTPRRPEPQRLDRGKRILFVDDEAAVRETMAESLEDAGFDVLQAADGAAALSLLASEPNIDVLVTDLSMPGMNGLTLIRNARRHRPALPAVLLTGYTGHGAQLAVGSSLNGTFTLVRKPVTAAQLADRVEALLAVTLPAEDGSSSLPAMADTPSGTHLFPVSHAAGSPPAY